MSSLPLGGTTYTPGSLVAFVQSRIDAGNQVVTAKADWLKAVKAYEAIDKQTDLVVHDLKRFVIGAFGATSSKLADFGFTAPQGRGADPRGRRQRPQRRGPRRGRRGTPWDRRRS